VQESPETGIDTERLRNAFLSAAGSPSVSCPSADLVWEVVAGAHPAAVRRDVVDHVATCPACRRAWQLARELSDSPPAAIARSPWPIAAAAVVVLAAGLSMLLPRALRDDASSGAPRFRADVGAVLGALPADGATLPRGEPTLRWTELEDGTLYDLDVTTADLAPVARATNLEVARYELPAEALASLPSGTRLLWRVQARRPDGSRTSSPTFESTLE
jgi:hypothetical protein